MNSNVYVDPDDLLDALVVVEVVAARMVRRACMAEEAPPLGSDRVTLAQRRGLPDGSNLGSQCGEGPSPDGLAGLLDQAEQPEQVVDAE
jgi:hypothetical protein